MKPAVVLFVALSAFAVAPAFAQSTRSLPPAPPPPGMNDPGVKATQPPAPAKPASAQSAHATPATSQPRDAHGEAPPQVTVRQEGDNTVQEYRRSGMLYMVVVTPKVGPPQTYLVDPNGKLYNQSGPREPVKPVMYKVMEWGKSKPAEASSSP